MNIPKGYRLVPTEPTEDMINAGQDQEWTEDVYVAMLAAAPTTPQPIYDEAKERELFEAYCAKVGLPIDTLPSGEYPIPATRFMSQGWQARAKAGENE